MSEARISVAASTLMFAAVLSITIAAAEAGTTPTASVQNIHYWSTSDHTRVVIAMDLEARYEDARLTSPDRVYFDISNAKLSSNFEGRNIVVGDQLLKMVRVAQNRPDMVRVVLDTLADDYSVSELHDPFRIVIDLYGRSGSQPGLNVPKQAPKPRPDVKGQEAAPRQSAGESQAVKKVPEILTSPEADKVASADAVVEQKTQNSPPVVSGSSPSAGTEPSSSSADNQIFNIPVPPPAQTKERREGPSQEKPLSIDAKIVSGFYSSYARGGGSSDQSLHMVQAGARFDINGYYMTPDLLDYSVQPEFNTGAQATDAGFEGGNGVRMRVSLLRRRVIPVTFRYSNVQLKDVYFGSLSQVSSYTRNSHNKDLGLTAGLQHSGLPEATLDWGTSSVNSESGIAGIPDYSSRSNHLNLDLTYQRMGWEFRGFAGRQQQISDLLVPQDEGISSSVMRQNVLQYRASARRDFLKDSGFNLEVGSQSTANILLNRPIDLTTRYANASLRMFQRRRWKASLHAGYDSNITALLMTQLAGGLGVNGSIAPDSSVLVPFRHTTSYLNLNGLTSVDLSHGFNLYGSLDRIAVLTARDSNLSSRYLTAAGGATYSHTFGWGSLSGQYGRSFGTGAVGGLGGRLDGQNYVVTAQPGKWDRVQFDLSVHGTDQRIRNEQSAREHSFASDAGIGLLVSGQFRARLGGGWQQSVFTNGGTDFHTKGFTARAGIEHPRFQLSGSLNSVVGNTLQAYGQIFGEIGVGSALLTPMHIVPSDFRGMTLSLHAFPIRRLELSALWTRSIQHLQGAVANDFEIIDVYLTFHFRKLEIVAGYFGSAQIYTSYLATYPETQRGRYYVRITRIVKFI